MRGVRKNQSLALKGKMEPSRPLNCSGTARNLNKSDLGGVIFGCTHSTIEECYSRELFGLPSRHISYVRNIDPGLPLFLFNYSDRKLHGIFEAASKGMLNINSSAWSADGSDSTPYAAQVKYKIHMECQPLLEDQFSTVISDNYYKHKLFWFELDQKQTRNLISLFSSSRLVRNELVCSSMENSNSSVNLDRGFSKRGSCYQNISSFGGDNKFLDPLKSDVVAEVCLEKPLSKKTWSSLLKGSATSEAKKEPEDFMRNDLVCSSMEKSNSSVNLDRGFSKRGSCYQNISSFGGDNKFLDPLKSDMAAEVCLEKPLSKKTWSSLFKGSATSEAKKEAEETLELQIQNLLV